MERLKYISYINGEYKKTGLNTETTLLRKLPQLAGVISLRINSGKEVIVTSTGDNLIETRTEDQKNYTGILARGESYSLPIDSGAEVLIHLNDQDSVLLYYIDDHFQHFRI